MSPMKSIAGPIAGNVIDVILDDYKFAKYSSVNMLLVECDPTSSQFFWIKPSLKNFWNPWCINNKWLLMTSPLMINY